MAYAIFFGKQMKQRINETGYFWIVYLSLVVEAWHLCDFVIGREKFIIPRPLEIGLSILSRKQAFILC